jgi:hypothetical protein
VIPAKEKRNAIGGCTRSRRLSAALTLVVVLAGLMSSGRSPGRGRTASANSAVSSTEGGTQAPSTVSDQLPAGTRLHVRLLQSISNASANSGDPFDAELSEPLEVGGVVVLPRGTRISGRVTSARSSGRLSTPGFLQLTLDSVQTPDGGWHNLETTSVSLRGSNHKRRNASLIGGGAGLGALIGGIASGGTGLALGALSGAGAGTVGAVMTGKKDVGFAAERTLVFTTKSEVVLRP